MRCGQSIILRSNRFLVAGRKGNRVPKGAEAGSCTFAASANRALHRYGIGLASVAAVTVISPKVTPDGAIVGPDTQQLEGAAVNLMSIGLSMGVTPPVSSAGGQ